MEPQQFDSADQLVDFVRDHDWRISVGGQLVPATSGRRYDLEDPTTEAVTASVPDGDRADVERAVDAARDAAAAWRRTPLEKRADTVRELARVLAEHAAELAALDALDSGLPVQVGHADVLRSAGSMRLFASWATEALQGRVMPLSSDRLHYTIAQPFGVVARIIPFNHPAMFATAKIAAPLVAGNCVILKPSDQAPLSALRIGEIFAELLPPGVLSVLSGLGPAVGEALVSHRRIFRVAFTGSEAVGRSIQRTAADVGVKTVSLELGGKNAMIVLPDADIDAAVDGAIRGMNFNFAGQSCGSTSRLLLHESLADEFVAKLAAGMSSIGVGAPMAGDTGMGPVVSRRQYDRVMSYLDFPSGDRPTVVLGGGRAPGFERGHFVAATLLDHVRPDMRVAREEIFGPVVSAIRFRDVDEALRVANDTDYGLTASVWTADLGSAHRLANELEAGYVWINDTSTHYHGMPFGGVKSSGVGREGSIEEIQSYTQQKTVNVIHS